MFSFAHRLGQNCSQADKSAVQAVEGTGAVELSPDTKNYRPFKPERNL